MLAQFKSKEQQPVEDVSPTQDNEVITGFFNDTCFGIVKYTLIKVLNGKEEKLHKDDESLKGFIYALDLGAKYPSPVGFFFRSFIDDEEKLQAEIRLITPLNEDAQLLHSAIMKTIQTATLHIVPRIYNRTLKNAK